MVDTSDKVVSTSKSVATQTIGTWMDHIQARAESCGLALVELKPIKQQFWAHMLACMRMPRGGVNGGGSMHCEFEFVAANERVVQHLMEDLPVMKNKRYNLSIPAPHWEDSPSIRTYYALETHLLDSYMRLHRRAPGARAYRGSVLAAPPHTYQAPVNLLSVGPPLLMELCHRKHNKLVLAVSFKLIVMNDMGLLTLPPTHSYAVGMDQIFRRRALNHLKKLRTRREPMSDGMKQIVARTTSNISDSEGEWQAPDYDLDLLGLPPRGSVDPGSDSGAEVDAEEEAMLRAARDTIRPRAQGSRWEGKMRNL